MFRLFHTFSKNKYYNLPLTLNRLQKLRLPTPIDELKRLSNNSFIKNRLDNLNHYFKEIDSESRFSIYHQVALGRILEIQENSKNTHYVFTHGQAGCGFLLLNILTKLFIEHTDGLSFSLFETVFRHPVDLAEISYTVDWYKKIIKPHSEVEILDQHLTDHLICADAYLSNTRRAESALSFSFSTSYRQVHLIEKAIMNIANGFIENEDIRNKFFNDFKESNQKIASSSNGVLFAICIPKEYFNQCGYISKPLGFPVNVKDEDVPNILEQLQNEKTVYNHNDFSLENYRSILKDFQVRLLAHKLIRGKVSIFVFPAIADEKFELVMKAAVDLFEIYRKHYKEKIQIQCLSKK